MRILITGATGFIGQRLVRRMLRAGHEVVGLTRVITFKVPSFWMVSKVAVFLQATTNPTSRTRAS